MRERELETEGEKAERGRESARVSLSIWSLLAGELHRNLFRPIAVRTGALIRVCACAACDITPARLLTLTRVIRTGSRGPSHLRINIRVPLSQSLRFAGVASTAAAKHGE